MQVRDAATRGARRHWPVAIVAALLGGCPSPEGSEPPAAAEPSSPSAERPAVAERPPQAEPPPTAAEPPATSTAKPEGSPCTLPSDCESGVCEGEGCEPGEGRCVSAQRMCTRDLRPYCGCDGETFRSSGSCPGQRFRARGACEGDEPSLPQ